MHDYNDLLSAIKNYNKRNEKSYYLTLYQDGSGYLGEEVGIFCYNFEIAFKFQNIEDLLSELRVL
jgi:hypothetical protein